MRIAVCGTKGGSGKSTLAGLLALCLNDAGRKVCAVDKDPQWTLTTWLQSVGGKRFLTPTHYKDSAPQNSTLLGEWGGGLEPNEDCIWIEDYPPASPQVLLQMLGKGEKPHDLLLIPCRPALADIWSIRSFLEGLDGYNGKVRLVMNALDNSSISKAGSIESLLKGIKTPRTKATLSRRACYSYAMAGGWPALDEKAKSEVLSLALEIMK